MYGGVSRKSGHLIYLYIYIYILSVGTKIVPDVAETEIKETNRMEELFSSSKVVGIFFMQETSIFISTPSRCSRDNTFGYACDMTLDVKFFKLICEIYV